MRSGGVRVGLGLAVALGLSAWLWFGGHLATLLVPKAALAAPTVGAIEGPDKARAHLPVGLLAVAQGVAQVTDIQPIPGRPGHLAVLRKTGEAAVVVPRTDATAPLPAPVPAFAVKVPTRSEQGLLGLAFHPKYPQDRRFYLHYTVATEGGSAGRVAEWRGPFGPEAREVRVIIEVPQPFANHNGGQIVFGPDGRLYIGMGDGGSARDPEGHGQNRGTLLGSMLRIDVEPAEGGGAYGVPADNPFVGQLGVRPEIWAYGLRNPWRFSFAPDGRLVAADVGQNRFEEITFVGAGQNLGWNIREADTCFGDRPAGQGTPADAECRDATPAAGLVDPIYAYPRADGVSVTGGHVYGGTEVPNLRGKYVFGDFGSGRIWALDLPPAGAAPPPANATRAWALGRFSMQISTFGVGHDGALFVGDFGGGVIYRVVAPPPG